MQDSDYWSENVPHTAAAWLASGSKGEPLVASEIAIHAHLPGGTDMTMETNGDEGKRKAQINRDRRQAKKRRNWEDRQELKKLRANQHGPNSEGKFQQGGKGQSKGKTKDQSGKPLCFAWSAGNSPCGHLGPGSECLGTVKRVHKCRICVSPSHQEAKCTSK